MIKTKQTHVCDECITMMSAADYAEHGGRCQICRGEQGLFLWKIQWQVEYGDDDTIHKVYPTRNSDEAEHLFREEYDEQEGEETSYEYIHAYLIDEVAGHKIIVK